MAEGTQPKAVELRIAVAAKVVEKSPTIMGKVIDSLSDIEIQKREDMLVKALTARDEAEKKIRKIKPDVETFGSDGAPISQGYSKAKKEELFKAKQELEKLDKAIDLACADKPDYSKINEMFGKQDKQDKPAEEKPE